MTTNYAEILEKIEMINPIAYSRDRNFIDGSVSQLSPYISRGLISTKKVYKMLIQKGYQINKIEKFIQELCWRDYWQILWREKNINLDLKHTQTKVSQTGVPFVIAQHCTQIDVIDSSIKKLYSEGYIHNHSRMYIASLVTNIARCHWYFPAQWMYYYLLDADWGSNALSWQWVCGTNSNKKYYANQSNINKFTKTNQLNTILDTSYESLIGLKQPKIFKKISPLSLKTTFPLSQSFTNSTQQPICIYNFYNLDLNWRQDIIAHRILLIEPSIFKKHPISDNSMKFMLELSKNIPDIKIFVGEFNELPINGSTVYYKEHPLNYNYKGIEDEREWLSNTKEYFSSFFKFWAHTRKELANN